MSILALSLAAFGTAFVPLFVLFSTLELHLFKLIIVLTCIHHLIIKPILLLLLQCLVQI